MLAGLLALHDSLNGGLSGALARFGSGAAIVGTAGAVVLVALDGFAAKPEAESGPQGP